MIVVLPSALAASYYFTNPKMAAQASPTQAGGAAFALLILLVQTAARPKNASTSGAQYAKW